MQEFLFGTMDEFIEAGYAPTGRAACRGCRGKIEKGDVRVGECMENDHFNARLWHHLPCFKLKPLFKAIDPSTQIYKLDQLEEEDRQKVIQYFEREVGRLNGGGKGKGRSANKAKSKPNKAKAEKQEEPEAKPAVKRVTRSHSRPKSKAKAKVTKRETSPSPSPSSPSPSPPAKKGRARKNASKSTKGSVKKTKKPKYEQAYSEQQKAKLQELLQKYMKMSADRLKEILGANGQPKNGKKAELAEKCADGELLGRIPQCPSCGGGKLRFMWNVSLYKCPGFMDDEEFKNCNRHFTLKEIARQPWVQS